MSKDFEIHKYTIPPRARSKRRREGAVEASSLERAIASTVGTTGSSSSASGHSHSNKDVLDSLSLSDGYLLSNGEKISAGAADTAAKAAIAENLSTGSTDWQKILRKDVADTAAEVITFAKGIISTLKSYFRAGINVTGTTQTDGLRVANDADVEGDLHVFCDADVDGNLKAGFTEVSELKSTGAADIGGVLKAGKTQALAALIDYLKSKNIVTENLTVTGAAHFFSLIIDELKSQQGAVIITSANCKADLVKPLREISSGLSGYIVYFRASDADGHKVANSWLVGDQAICQTFNAAAGTSYNVSNRYYWRLVEAVSAAPVTLDDGNDYHYIVLSETVYAAGGTDEPAAGDYIVQLGYRGTDSTVLPGRRSAIILSAYPTPDTELVPALFAKYAGINDFALSPHRETYLDASRSRFVGEFSVLSGGRTISISNAVAEELMGGASNYLKGSDFATAGDIGACWSLSSGLIVQGQDRLNGQQTMIIPLAASGIIMRLRQTVTSMGDVAAGTQLCLSAYVRRTTVASGTTAVGFENNGVAFEGLAWTGSNISGNSRGGSGSRYYAQIQINDTEWHRVWATFTPSSMASFAIGIFGWADSSMATANLPTYEVAMPKLEIGSEPTQWTPMADVLRRAGIDIVGSAVKIYGENISLEGTVTANGGFSIGLDGSMWARNGTFSGFVRTEMRCIDSTLLPSLVSTDADFIGPESMEGSSDYLAPTATSAGEWLDLLKSGSCFLFNAASAPVHLPFVATHGYYSQRTFEAAFREAYDDNTKYWAEVLRARSFVGSTIEIVNQSGGFVYICGIGGSDLSTGTFPTNAWERYALGNNCMIRLECRRTTTGAANQGYIDTVDWHVVSYAANVTIPVAALT